MASHEIQNPSLENILAAVSDLKIGQGNPILDGEFNGGECRVLKLSYIGYPSVAVRIRHHSDDSSNDDTIAIVQSEVRILNKLEAKGFQWSPRCLGASFTFDNPIQHPFIVLSWAEGSPLTWDDNVPRRPIRDTLLAQIASIQQSLITCTLEKCSITAADFFERQLRNRHARVRAGKIPSLSDQDCRDQQALFSQVIGQDQDNKTFAMDHGDLKPGNIIVDKDNNIQCVIDWGFAATVPVARAAILPRFLWPDDSARVAPSQIILDDRRAYVSSYSSQYSQAALFMRYWQSAEDVDFRILYLDSISSKGVHTSMAQVRWHLPYCKSRQGSQDVTDVQTVPEEAASLGRTFDGPQQY